MSRSVRVLLAATGAVFFVADAAGEQPFGALQLALRADRTSYVLGEPVNLDVKVVNLSSTPAVIPEGADVWVGHLELLIAFEDGRYRTYRGPGWGLTDSPGSGSITLLRGQAHMTQATILYHQGVDTDHLNARRAREIREHFLETGYALAMPGRYRIKARLYDERFADSIASAPIDITVDEPDGIDRDVWAVLKENPDFGYFIQSGGPHGHPTAPENVRMVETLEELANEQPLGRYAEVIRRSLDIHRELVDDLRVRGLIDH